MNRGWKILTYISITFGFSCLFFSIFIDPKTLPFTITLALGLSLLPTGIIAIITSISSSNIIEGSIRKKLAETNFSLQTSINNLQVASEYLNKSKELGVEMVYENRNQAQMYWNIETMIFITKCLPKRLNIWRSSKILKRTGKLYKR